jgi:hypothetical protein
MAKKISDRAAILLALIIDYTLHDDTGRLSGYWCPIYGRQPSVTLGGGAWVSGGADAAVLRSLARRGFIKMENTVAYAASATEEGGLYFEREIRETGRLEDLRRIVAKNDAVLCGPQEEEEEEET